MNSVNPYRIEGQKTNAYEIYEQLGYKVPDYVVLPVGNAGNISAIWKGFKELKEWRISESLPRMVAVQAAGAQPIVEAFEHGRDSVVPVQPKTIASAINIGNPASWKKALAAIRDSKGMALAVTRRGDDRGEDGPRRERGDIRGAGERRPDSGGEEAEGKDPERTRPWSASAPGTG